MWQLHAWKNLFASRVTSPSINERVESPNENFWAHTDEEGALQRYRTLLDTLDDGVYQLDAEGHFVAVNDRIVEATGYDRTELLESHVSLVLDDAEITRIQQEIRGLLTTETDSVATLDLPVQTASGDTITCELRVSLLEIDGEFRGTVGVARDITERKQREQTHEQERDLLDRVFEASPIGITALDPDGEVITLNEPAIKMFGMAPEDQVESYEPSDWAVYDDDGELIPPEERAFAQVAETGEPVTDFEAQVNRHDGGRVWLSFNGAPVFDSEGELSMVVLTFEDVTELKGREQHLQRERAQTDKLLQTAPVAIAVQNANGETVMANQRAQEALGLTEQEIIDEPENADEWTTYDADGEPLADDDTPSARVLATGEPVFDEEIAIEPPDGERMWFRINAAPLFEPDQTIDRVITTGEDITELKQRERQLEQRKSELETELGETLGRISDAFYALDDEWRFTHVNAQAEEIIQHSEDDLIGQSVWEVFPDATDGLFWDEFQTAMDTQEPTSFEFYAEEFDAWLEFNAYPSETGMSIYFQDITERKEYEQALEESERRYRTLVENFPGGAVGLFDEDLRYTAAGGQHLKATGTDPEERIGRSIHELYSEDLIEEIEPYFLAALEGESNDFEVEYGDRQLYAQTLPIGTADDEVSPGMLVIQDVTERREYQRQLEESNERLEQFAYAASHDLQEPLRMVTSYLQLLERRYGDELDDDAKEFIEFAVDGAERMRGMIEGLLQYSRVETQGDEFESVGLEAVYEDVREDLQMKIHESDAEITAEELPHVYGDEKQLRQVFQNLLSNAIENSGDTPPRIDISSNQRGSEWMVSIADEGVGIDPDAQDRIFEIFQRIPGNTNHAGSGIGLALCERIVERHGGKIWVESEPGEGATVSFTLPAVQET